MVNIHAPYTNKFILPNSQSKLPQSRMQSLVHLLKYFYPSTSLKVIVVRTRATVTYSVNLKVTGDSAKLNHHSNEERYTFCWLGSTVTLDTRFGPKLVLGIWITFILVVVPISVFIHRIAILLPPLILLLFSYLLAMEHTLCNKYSDGCLSW